MRSGVDMIIAEHALNDLYYGHIQEKPAVPHTAAVLEQVLVQARARAPGAAFVYAGVLPNHHRCWSAEDLPGNADVLRHWGATYVSTRNLVLGRPPAPPPDASPWETWRRGYEGECNIWIEPPFDWELIFPGGGGHPRAYGNLYLSLLMASAMTEAMAALAAQRWAAPTPTPLPAPLHDASHGAECFGGAPFECRTTLSPSFGARLRPLPDACAIAWHGKEPVFDAETCGDVWESSDTPPVAGWAMREMGDFRNELGGKLRVRQDVKYFLFSNTLNATARFPVRVGPRRTVGVAYFIGQEFGVVRFTLRCGDGDGSTGAGTTQCRHHEPVHVDGVNGQYVTRTAIVARDVEEGVYVLEVLAWPGLFALVGVAG